MNRAILIFISIFIGNLGFSANISSNGTGGGDFTVGASWAGGVAPVAGDNVTILAGDVINFNPPTASRTITNLTLNGTLNFNTNNKTLNVSGFLTTTGNGILIGGANTRSLSVTGTFTIPAGNSVDVQGINLTVGGVVTLNGTLLCSTNAQGTKTFSSNLILNNGSAITFNIGEAITVSGNLTANGTCTVLDGSTSGSLNITGLAGFSAGCNATLGRGTIAVTGAGTVDGTLTLANTNGNKNFTSDLTVNNGAAVVYTVAETLQIGGNLTLNGTSSFTGTGIVNVSTNQTVSVGAAVTCGPVDWTVQGLNTISGSFTINGTTGSHTYNGNLIINGSLIFDAIQDATIAGNVTVNPGGLFGGGTADGLIDIAGSLTAETGGASTISSLDIDVIGDFSLNGTAICTISDIDLIGGDDFSVKGSSLAIISNTTMDLVGDVDINTTAVMDASGGGLVITMEGSWLNTSLAADPFVEGNSSVTLNSAAALQTIVHMGAGETFYYLHINNSSGLNPAIQASNHVNVSNEYDQSNGIFDLTGFDLTVSSGATSSTTCLMSGGSIVSSAAGSAVDFSDGAGDNLIVTFSGTDVGSATNDVPLTVNTGRSCYDDLELYGTGIFTKTLNTDDVCTGGGNIFHDDITFTATLTASRWRMGNGASLPDRYEGNATFNANAKGGTNNNFIIGAGSSGNEYFGTTTFTSTTRGGFFIGRSGSTNSHTFHGPVAIHVADSGNVTLGDCNAGNPSTIILESTIQLNSLVTSVGDIYVGSASGASTVTMNLNGRIIDGTILGATNIYFNSITQNNALANNTTSGAATASTIYVGNAQPTNACIFNGNVTFTSPNITLRGSTFNGTNSFQSNGSTNFTSYGGNTFNGVTSFTNNGTGYWRLANNASDDFNANVTFTQSGLGVLAPVYSNDCTFSRNITTGATNALIFGSGGGRVILDGSVNQDINGNSSFIPTWVRGRLLNTNGDVDLNVPLNISTDFDFQDGVMNTTSTNLLIFNAGSTASNATSNSYVDGPCRKVGNTLFAFPVGDNAFYAPITISAPSNVAHHFTAQYFDVDPNTPGFTTTSKVAALDHVSTCEYWILDRTNGASTVTVTLDYLDTRSCTIPTLSDLRVARWDGAIWQNHGNGGTPGTTTSGTIVTAGVVAAFSPFTLASIATGTDLPVELTEFSVYKEGKEVELEWSTITESNNDYFSIERSSDLAVFTKIGEVDGNGNSNQRIDYRFTDQNPLIGISYYRLAQHDFNGEVNYSDVRSVNFNGDFALQVYPNPIENNSLTLIIDSNDEMIGNISIIDLTGKEVFMQKQSFLQGNNTLTLEMNDLSSGVYFIRVNESIMKFVVK